MSSPTVNFQAILDSINRCEFTDAFLHDVADA